MVKRAKKTTISAGSCQAIRQKLPDSLKEKFGSLGFVKWTCAYCPVLIVDPMQTVLSKAIPEGIYHAWLYQIYLNSNYGMEEEDDDDDEEEGEGGNESHHTHLENLPILIFWFGTTYEFSIVRCKHVVDWKEGCRRGYHQLPEFMEERIQNLHRPVPTAYALIEDALQRVDEKALKLPPEERSLAIVSSHGGKKKQSGVILNEWHTLAMDDPPQMLAWVEQKEMIVEELPHAEWFGQVAFLPHKCGSHNYHHPVLVLSPFRVPPNLRTEWFHKCSSGSLVMVYWMGAYTSGRMQNSVYTYHPLSDLIRYDEGAKLKYDRVPRTVLQDYEQRKLSAKRLPGIDWWVCGTMWELPQALEREAKDRWGGLEDFEEDYDDNFDYYWECLHAAKEAAMKARDKSEIKQKGSKKQSKQDENFVPAEEDDDDALEEEEIESIPSGNKKAPRSKPLHVSPRQNGQQSSSPPVRSPNEDVESGLFDDSSEDESSPSRVGRGIPPLSPESRESQKVAISTGSSLEQETITSSVVDETKNEAVESSTNAESRMNGQVESASPKTEKNGQENERAKLEAPNQAESSPLKKGKDVGSRSNANTIFSRKDPLKIPLREEEEDFETSNGVAAYPARFAQKPTSEETRTVTASSTDSDQELHDAVQDSLLGCAAYLQEESQKATERRVKRKAGQALLSPPTKRAAAKAPDRILQLKRRKEATKKLALGAIQKLTKDDS